jgi:hypothetical protein
VAVAQRSEARAQLGLRRGRVDLERGTVQVIEVVTEPKGWLHFGPPNTSAGRRMVGLPRFVVEALLSGWRRRARPRTSCSLARIAACCG